MLQIYEFPNYDLDPNNSLKTRDIQELIDTLKSQHDFIHESEVLQKLFYQIKSRCEKFCSREFLPIIGGTTQPEVHQSIFEGVFHRELNEQFNLINYIEIYVDEFDHS